MNKTLVKEREKKLSEILKSFSGDFSESTDNWLYSLWVKISKVSGWAGIIGRKNLLPKSALLKLEVFDDEVIAIIKKEEIYYYSKVVPEVKKKLREFTEEVKEIELEFVKNRRLEYLGNEIKQLEKETKEIFELFKKNGFSFFGDVILKVFRYSEKVKKIKRFQFEYRSIKFNKGSTQSFPEEYIEMARNADCAQFLDIKKRVGGKAWTNCPFHNEKTPSFCCYEDGKGFFCYGCGVGGDAITLVRKLHNMGFREAVNFINNK